MGTNRSPPYVRSIANLRFVPKRCLARSPLYSSECLPPSRNGANHHLSSCTMRRISAQPMPIKENENNSDSWFPHPSVWIFWLRSFVPRGRPNLKVGRVQSRSPWSSFVNTVSASSLPVCLSRRSLSRPNSRATSCLRLQLARYRKQEPVPIVCSVPVRFPLFHA